MSTREDIATRATIAGVTKVTPFYRQSLKPGDGFVEFAGKVRGDNGFGWIDTWNVWIAVPQDVEAAERWLEEHMQDVIDEVDIRELIVTTAGPSNRLLGGQVVNGLVITGTREG